MSQPQSPQQYPDPRSQPLMPPTLLLKAASIVKEVEHWLALSEDNKENRCNNLMTTSRREIIQLSFREDIAAQIEDLSASFYDCKSYNKRSETKGNAEQIIQAMSKLIKHLQQVRIVLLKATFHPNKPREIEPLIKDTNSDILQLQNILPQLNIRSKESRSLLKVKDNAEDSSKGGSKRSLLTQKIKQAELEEEESESILRTLRDDPNQRINGNLISLTKVRDRTVPLKMEQFTAFKSEQFSFSSQQVELCGQRARCGGGRKSEIASSMGMESAGRQRRIEVERVGCSRCQIY